MEIEFRGWCTYIVGKPKMYSWKELKNFREWFFSDDFVGHRMQHIGLKDINGKKIFEGDIIRLEHDYFGKKEIIEAVVQFYTEGIGSCGCCFEEFTGSGWAAFPKAVQSGHGISLTNEGYIIGNIYENPELIPNA